MIIVFIIGAALGAASGGARTATTTIQIQSTVTQAADTAKYAASMKAILSGFRDISLNTADNMCAFSNHQMSQADLPTFIREQKSNLERLTESALRLQSPPTLTEAHVHTVKAFSLAYSAFVLYEDGLIQNNVSLINEGTAFINQATNESKTATSILNSTS